jgi:hypothetical protein
MTAYDEKILQEYADSLYREAKRIVFRTASIFGCVAFLISAVLAGVFSLFEPQMGVRPDTALSSIETLIVILLTVAGTLAGVAIGRQKAFRLKLQAQQTLCQRQIELNTRHER